MAKRRKSTNRRKKTAIRKRKTTHVKLDVVVVREISAIAWGLVGGLFLIAMLGSQVPIWANINSFLAQIFGLGRYFVPFAFFVIAITLFFSKKIHFTFFKNLGIAFFVTSVLGLIHMSLPMNLPFEELKIQITSAGGWVGFTASFLRIFIGDAATYVILIALLLIGFLITFELSLKDLFSIFVPKVKFTVYNGQTQNKETKNAVKIIKPDFSKKEIEAAEKEIEKTVKEIKAPKKKKELNIIKPDIVTKKQKEAIEIKNTEYTDWEFPTLDLLKESNSETFADDRLLMKNAEKIRQKLAQFGINVTMKDVHVGPTVTQYSLLPNEGVKLTKITALKDDLALALAAKSLRIEAPIPGKSVVGIELPNEKRTVVHMRELLESEEFTKLKSSLRLTLGRDVAGKPVVVDLAKMPHLLIAGATGAGKSVGMNSFLISLLYQNSPQDLKFIMIDPKRVELSIYNSIPHLLTPVITDAEKALSALKWAVAEMMRRYTLCSDHKCRNIEEYNKVAETKIPKIVIVIDELADLMMRQFKKDTEAAICRLAQMARAVGMHLIVATQRPSVDVITGLIKANIPTRISFAVTSSIDSRTIIDSVGAEDLLGMGDMLFLNSSLGKPVRVQGIYVSTEEVQKVTNRIKVTKTDPEYQDITREEEKDTATKITSFSLSDDDEQDDLVGDAVELIKQTGKASASLFQRHLKVGYARAARLLDILEEKGVVGPAKGAKPREIFIELEDGGES